MSAKKRVMYICMHCAKVVDTKDQKRHSRNCSSKQSLGQYEEPEISSSDEEDGKKLEDENTRIIDAVRKRQPLWDNRMSKTERNPVINMQHWIEVDAELGMEKGKSKTIWINLRHKFNAERRKVEAGEETSWVYYSPLLFLIATRQPKLQSPDTTSPLPAAQKVVVPKMFEPKKNKVASNPEKAVEKTNHQQVNVGSIQLIPASSKRTFKSSKEPLYVPSRNFEDDRRERELSEVSTDSDVDVVEEINMNGNLLQRHNPVSYKRVCIRRMQETQLENIDDEDEDDEIRRFCSYLEVMLRKMPKMNQEMFCEETLDHLASVNRKLRRSNF